MEGYEQDWEDRAFEYPASLASPLQILIDASNGASDYGNKFGEPLLAGFTRSFGMRLPNGERREWLKPIMFRWGSSSSSSLLYPPSWHTLAAQSCSSGCTPLRSLVMLVFPAGWFLRFMRMALFLP